MKKTLLVFLCAILCIANVCLFAACQDTTPEESATPAATTPASDATTAGTVATPDATPSAESTPTADATTEGSATQDATQSATQSATQEPTPTPTAEPVGLSGTVAHWKFQNDSKYFSGSLNGTNLKFNDLSGNGNTLEVKVEGNGDKFDVFSWDSGSTLKSGGSSALYFGNTYDNAKKVAPSEYSSNDMQWTGGTYVSGKYFSTVSGAPMNDDNFEDGYTVEIIFKIDTNFNNNYNRYAGMFSRQGIVGNEPWFSMALTESSTINASGAMKSSGTIGLQLVQSAKNAFQAEQNVEHSSITEGQWVHYMIVSNNGQINAYVNGQKVDSVNISCASIGDSGFGWDVGVGRKDFTGQSVKNPAHEEGGIRRLFCGTISEIRVVDHAITVEESLYNAPVNN